MDEKELEDEVISKYLDLTMKSSIQVHLHYEYYLTLFSAVRHSKELRFTNVERNFLYRLIPYVNRISKETELMPTKNKEIKELILYQLGVSVAFFYRKLYNVFSEQKSTSNKYKRIFKTDFAYNFFEQLRGIVQNDIADYSFIYRKMILDKLIFDNVGLNEFTRFLSAEYEVEIDKMKQLDNCRTVAKEQLYTTIKDLIS